MLSTLKKSPVGTLTIATRRGGSVAVTEDHLITVVTPLLGLPQEKRWWLYQTDRGPFYWLQSLTNPAIQCCLLAPFLAGLDPDMVLGSEEVADIGVEDASDIDIYTMVVLERDLTPARTNLRAPLLVGRTTGLAKQVVLSDARLPIRFCLRDLSTLGD
jgi:flagellar assembly factor FliW